MKLNNILVLIKNMLEYDRIDFSEGIDIKKCNENIDKLPVTYEESNSFLFSYTHPIIYQFLI